MKAPGDAVPTVFVVDDDAAMRNMLRRVFQSADLRVETFSDAPQFLDAYNTDQPGCLILDVSMPGMSGLELQKELKARSIRIPVIFLTGMADVGMAVQAMREGAADFLEKPVDNAALLERTQNALGLGIAVLRDDRWRNELKQRIAALTPRELEVLELMVAGKLSKLIADELDISPRTVDIHRARIMEKMQANNLAALVRMIMEARA